MAASLSADGRLWASCRHCHYAIYKYPNGALWRDSNHGSKCSFSPVQWHVPER